MYDNETNGYFNHLDTPTEGAAAAQDTAVQNTVPTNSGMSVNDTAASDNVMQAGNAMPLNQTTQASASAPVNQTAQAGGYSSVNSVAAANAAAAVNRANAANSGASAGGYSYAGGSAYANRTNAGPTAQNTVWTQAPVKNAAGEDKKSKTGEKKLGLAQKIMLSISLGLFFGIFAGIGFYGVRQASNSMQKASVIEEKRDTEERYDEKEPEEIKTPELQQATSNVVYTNAANNVPGIVKEVMPAMVSIVNYYTERSYSFWGQTYEEEVPASGSGIIVGQTDKELLIVTNNHVVEGANRLVVTLIDGTETEAKIKGTDADMDLAVISIALDSLDRDTKEAITVATLGDSDHLELGEQVIAIGNALGYGQSVTVGYISALNRDLEHDDGTVSTYIQTDAAINGGNSGGALLNAAGEVIGINSAKIGGYSVEGMGYAIPITAASPIIADLMERQTRNKVADSQKGYMGIEYQDVTDQIALMYGMPTGVYVLSVVEGSGADAAGMMRGDVIVKFDGNKISSYADLQKVLQYYAVGDSAKVTVKRPEHGEYVEYDLTIVLGERPKSSQSRK